MGRLKDLAIVAAAIIGMLMLWQQGSIGDLIGEVSEGTGSVSVNDGKIAYASKAQLVSARTKIELLETAGRAPKTGYDRDQFGKGWTDTNHNKCDTRNDILARDYTDIKLDAKNKCKVTAGTMIDPYSGELLAKPGDSDIDHVVALSNAWQMGASTWDKDKRVEFANDPNNLLAVSASQNRQKGDGDAATWLPKNKAYRCTYVAKQVEVKHTYGLRVTKAERDTITTLLDNCLKEAAR